MATLKMMMQQAAPVRSSFFLPMWFMSARRRRALHNLYDFCRCVDDAVDEVASAQEAQHNLEDWKHELYAIYHGMPLHLVVPHLLRKAYLRRFPQKV